VTYPLPGAQILSIKGILFDYAPGAVLFTPEPNSSRCEKGELFMDSNFPRFNLPDFGMHEWSAS